MFTICKEVWLNQEIKEVQITPKDCLEINPSKPIQHPFLTAELPRRQGGGKNITHAKFMRTLGPCIKKLTSLISLDQKLQNPSQVQPEIFMVKHTPPI